MRSEIVETFLQQQQKQEFFTLLRLPRQPDEIR